MIIKRYIILIKKKKYINFSAKRYIDNQECASNGDLGAVALKEDVRSHAKAEMRENAYSCCIVFK